MRQSKGICAGLPAAPARPWLSTDLGQCREEPPTSVSCFMWEPQKARTPHQGLPDPLPQRGQIWPFTFHVLLPWVAAAVTISRAGISPPHHGITSGPCHRGAGLHGGAWRDQDAA